MPLTLKGAERLRSELKRLKTERGENLIEPSLWESALSDVDTVGELVIGIEDNVGQGAAVAYCGQTPHGLWVLGGDLCANRAQAYEAARTKALEHYDARLLVQEGQKDSPPPVDASIPAATSTPINAEQIKLLMERIRNTREGPFASFTQQPALQALLLPFGGYGGLQLVEYLIKF